jgi:DNA-binding NarL/FixJ family response regulator
MNITTNKKVGLGTGTTHCIMSRMLSHMSSGSITDSATVAQSSRTTTTSSVGLESSDTRGGHRSHANQSAAGPASVHDRAIGLLRITPRERSVLQLLAGGSSPTDVAGALGVSESALDALLGVLFARMGVSGRAAAIESASRRGLLAHAENV